LPKASDIEAWSKCLPPLILRSKILFQNLKKYPYLTNIRLWFF